MNLLFEGIKNARDLGGILTADGRRIRDGCLLRMGDLSAATQKDLSMLEEHYQVCMIIDFRDTWEYGQAPDRELDGVPIYHYPMLAVMNFKDDQERIIFEKAIEEDPVGMLEKAYRDLAENAVAQTAYRHFFALLEMAGGKGVLWHCTQGKDRTGIATALLLASLGVSKEVIMEEYLLTNKVMEKEFEKLVQNGLPKSQWKVMRSELLVREECLNLFWNILEEKYGGTEQYLEKTLGITRELREKLNRLYCKED